VNEFVAFYRLQLGPHLSFRQARELLPYLRALGVSHIYLSPAFEAQPESTHGYDVIDPRRISARLGGEEEFRALCEEAPGIILDIVPNHMAAADANPFWKDVELRRRFFDVDPETGLHRRFFEVYELGGVRVEDPEVFEVTHRLALDLVREGLVDGLRIDHPDGLADPAAYLERLRDEGVRHVWVEKILEPGEHLRPWPVEGTTGYDFLNQAMKIFVDETAEGPLTELYAEFSGETRSWDDVAAEAKLEQATTMFAPEVARLCRLLDVPELTRALASFHVYRTYVVPKERRVDEADRREIERAEVGERLARVLLLNEPGHEEFVMRFQQTTGPVMAKGVEDCAFYRYNRLIALNEVGGAPEPFSLTVADFHARNPKRAPRSLLATSTHDTKRSADVRARLVALTWLPAAWREHVLRWRDLNADLRLNGAPDANEEYLLYQTLVGAWPLEWQRLEAFVVKALREGKVNTSWAKPNRDWETAALAFCRGLYERQHFISELEAFLTTHVAPAARQIALGQLLVKLTCPGIPDIYQGDELETLDLVDPDNRRPVDWDRRRRALDELLAGEPPTRETEQLYVIWKTLELRRRRADSFAGEYVPLDLGPGVCGYQRGDDVLVIVPVRAGAAKSPPPGWRDLFPELPIGLYERVA
jgi:(1->4)-alpha-D-glucan 1-alpha-D-glucosylmutase